MKIIDIAEAKNTLADLVAEIESDPEAEVIISRNGRPVARLARLTVRLLGIAKGQFVVPDNIDEDNEEIAKLFYGDD